MALFRSDDTSDTPRGRASSGNPAEQHTIVGAGTTLDGTLRARGNLNVAGSVTSTDAEIAGRIPGTLTVRERLVLRTTAVVDGDIQVGALVIEEGAVFNGRCEMGAGASEGLVVPGGLKGAAPERALTSAPAPEAPAVRSVGALKA